MLHSISEPKSALDSIPAYTAFQSGAAGRAHNEAGFHHFLRIERERSIRTGHRLLLVLVSIRGEAHSQRQVDSATAGRIFAALGASVREVDFVGWFKDGRVAAAALVQRGTPTAEVRQRIAGRVLKMAAKKSSRRSEDIRVRVVLLGGRR